MPVKGGYLALAGGGAILIWSALRGKQWSDVLRSIASGQPADTALTAYPIEGSTGIMPSIPGTTTGAIGSDSEIASDALRYAGQVPYRWGGANPNGWDCSGFINWVLNHDLGIRIPGYKSGTFTGHSHGPNTLAWLAWLPAHAHRIARRNVAAGDICLWQTHTGIAISNTQYVSAYDTAEGTVIHPIHGGGPIGEVSTFWALKDVAGQIPQSSIHHPH
jgi:cell wall-associated NlpC family hydrolase